MRKYKKIWDHFLMNEAEEFEAERKLTVREIRRIGIKKFVLANDWREEEDTAKWRTDVLEIVPCPHCKKDFGVLDDTLALCTSCLPLFDLRTFYKDIYNICGDNPIQIGKAFTAFMTNKQFRVNYLAKPNNTENKEPEDKLNDNTVNAVAKE